MTAKIHLRTATAADVPRLREVIEASVRGLQAEDDSKRRLKARCSRCMAWIASLSRMGHISWWKFQTRAAPRLSPVVDGASARLSTAEINMPVVKTRCLILYRMRRRFVRSLARHGPAAASAQDTRSLRKRRARSRIHPAGNGRNFKRSRFLPAKGYEAVENQEVPLGNGYSLPIVRMAKRIPSHLRRSS